MDVGGKFAVPQTSVENGCRYSVHDAQRLQVCRVCGKGQGDGPGPPFKLGFGREHAHHACLGMLEAQERGVKEMTDKGEQPIPDQAEHVVEDEPGQNRPNYYRVNIPATRQDTGERITVEVECFDVISALGLGFYEGNLLKYLWRTGRKYKERRSDLRKVLTYARQALERCED